MIMLRMSGLKTARATRLALPAACAALLGLSACADEQPVHVSGAEQAASPTQQRIPPQDFPPGTVAETPPPEGVKLVNDPSAPTDTPLCGTAAREMNAVTSTVYPQPLSSGNACVQNACFDPATVTYIASDGSRRVCR